MSDAVVGHLRGRGLSPSDGAELQGASPIQISKERWDQLRGPCIYAAFDSAGVCQYVGKAWNGIARPFGKHHQLDYNETWVTLHIWHVEVADDVELTDLEKQVINELDPVCNVGPCGPTRRARIISAKAARA